MFKGNQFPVTKKQFFNTFVKIEICAKAQLKRQKSNFQHAGLFHKIKQTLSSNRFPLQYDQKYH